jgi:pantoate--beta-alanine ligase
MRIIYDLDEMTETARGWLAGGSVGLVPTTGNLHAGHIALIQSSLQECELSVVSIFDHFLQLQTDKAKSRFPHSLASDLLCLDQQKVDIVFIPRPDDFYPVNFSTHIIPFGPIAERLEGVNQTEDIGKVATAMTKLFQLVRPDNVYLGQKKAQHVALIRQLVSDLNFDLNIRMLPIVRESDGVAVSSRLRLLSPAERQAAIILYQALLAGKDVIEKGERRSAVIEKVVTHLIATEPLLKLDYIALCNPDIFVAAEENLGVHLPDLLLVIAVHIGPIRLTDNILWKSSGY